MSPAFGTCVPRSRSPVPVPRGDGLSALSLLLDRPTPHPLLLCSPTRIAASAFSGRLPKKPLVSVLLAAAVASLSTARRQTHLGQTAWPDGRGVAPSPAGTCFPPGSGGIGTGVPDNSRGLQFSACCGGPSVAASVHPFHMPTAKGQVRGMWDRMRDRWGVDARPVVLRATAATALSRSAHRPGHPQFAHRDRCPPPGQGQARDRCLPAVGSR